MTVTTSAGVEIDDDYTVDDAATLALQVALHINNGSTADQPRQRVRPTSGSASTCQWWGRVAAEQLYFQMLRLARTMYCPTHQWFRFQMPLVGTRRRSQLWFQLL